MSDCVHCRRQAKLSDRQRCLLKKTAQDLERLAKQLRGLAEGPTPSKVTSIAVDEADTDDDDDPAA